MTRSAFLVSAAHKSSGKTTVAIGIGRLLTRRGLVVRPGKKGPDYIDPMWLARAANSPCYCYDFNTQDRDELTAQLARQDGDVVMIEGNKGLYDCVDPEGSDSNAALARLLELPVVLVVDCEGITRGIAPLLHGYCDFEEVDIRGVILNKVAGERHESKLRAAVERYTDLPVFGAVRRDRQLVIEERHLGLVPGNEHAAAGETVDAIADVLGECLDLDALLAATTAMARPTPPPERVPDIGRGLTVAVARDRAFGFYYADDLEHIAACGARIAWFSPLDDARLPDADALFLGGGFPESFAAALEANAAMRAAVRTFSRAGGPVYAECGGLMYLCRSLTLESGARHAMAGVFEADVVMCPRPSGRGLVVAAPTGDHPWRGSPGFVDTPFAAHEFHYSQLQAVPAGAVLAYEIRRGFGLDGRVDGIVAGNTLGTYIHQRHTRVNPWIDGFLAFTRHCTQRRAS